MSIVNEIMGKAFLETFPWLRVQANAIYLQGETVEALVQSAVQNVDRLVVHPLWVDRVPKHSAGKIQVLQGDLAIAQAAERKALKEFICAPGTTLWTWRTPKGNLKTFGDDGHEIEFSRDGIRRQHATNWFEECSIEDLRQVAHQLELQRRDLPTAKKDLAQAREGAVVNKKYPGYPVLSYDAAYLRGLPSPRLLHLLHLFGHQQINDRLQGKS
jgi:hypothetical protein